MKSAMKHLIKLFVLSAFAMSANAVDINTRILTVMDESGSMGGEHAWIDGMIYDLEAALDAKTTGSDVHNTGYGLVGFGTGSHGGGSGQDPHKHAVGGGDFGTAAEFDTAAGGLIASGGIEDGYEAMKYGLDNYAWGGNVKNLILVTDEDRDSSGGPSKATMTAALSSSKALMNAVLNVVFYCGDGTRALGVDADGTGYVADGSGGFTTCSGAAASSGFGSSIADYVGMAHGTGGAAWDLNLLRAGGLTATSFTAAFVAIKVQETIQAAEPVTLALMGLGLAGLGFSRRRKA